MEGYELIDAGNGRRLERFGDRLVDRPAPTAGELPRDRAAWSGAHLRFDRDAGWHGDGGPWEMSLGGLRLELRPTEAGQVGLFPEHSAHVGWLDDRVTEARPAGTVLHLFAYTGVTTLELARMGASVVHVDASRPAVAWARRNAELSGLATSPIRWIVDDAEGFVGREVRRGRRYDGVVVDPPSYGHARGGRSWRLEDRLPELLRALTRLEPRWILLTTHTPGWDGRKLEAEVRQVMRVGRIESGEQQLRARSGARLSLGWFARAIMAP